MYPWAYAPLLAAAALLGAAGLSRGRGPMPRTLIAALALIGVSIAVQLVPLSADALRAVSPHTIDIYRQRDLPAAVAARELFQISIAPRQTAIALASFGAFGLLLAGGARMLSRDSARRLAIGLAGVGVALTLVAVVQRATFNGRVYGLWPLTQGGQPFGPFINRNHFAGWMLMVLPLTIGLFASMVSRHGSPSQPGFRARALWFATEHANKAVLTAFAILVMTLAMALTMSRSGITALVAAIGFASWAMVRRQHDRGTRRLVVPIYVFLTAAMAFAWVGLDRIGARFAAAGSLDTEGRQAIWADTWRMIQDFWLTGTGLNTFGTAALFYQSRLKGSHMQEAHNDYLQIVSEGGLLVALPALAAIVILAATIRRRLSQDVGSIWWLRMGAVCGVLAVAVQSTVEFSLQIPANAALFAALCAIAVHDGGRLARDTVPPPDASRSPVDDRASKIVHIDGASRELRFSIDTPPAAPAASSHVDLAALDDVSTPIQLRTALRSPARRVHRASETASRRTIGLTAALTLAAFALLILAVLST